MGYLESTTNITGSRKTVQKIVVTWSGWRDRILNQADVEGYGDVALFISEDRDDLMRELADADAVMAVVWNAELLSASRRLGWVHAVSGGIESYLFPEFVDSPVPFTCAKPTFGVPGAESALPRCSWSHAATIFLSATSKQNTGYELATTIYFQKILRARP